MKQLFKALRKEGGLSGCNRRLLREWEILEERLSLRDEISYSVTKYSDKGVAMGYRVDYYIKSICGIDQEQRPLYAEHFVMNVDIPDDYPCVDAPLEFWFQTRNSSGAIAHPWHPNIRYYGAFAGRVCLNAMDSFTEIAWCVERVASYLKYERYHAHNHPPYPEDLTVANWVIEIGEPMGFCGK